VAEKHVQGKEAEARGRGRIGGTGAFLRARESENKKEYRLAECIGKER